jgi:hypothetical protein
MSRIGNFTETMGEPNKEEPKINSFLYSVIWRNWIVPIFITLVVSIATRIIFHYIPENIVTNEFFAGWISCQTFYVAHKRYAI